ncbi:MAG: hypothetical protein ACK4RM_10020 [Flavobacterium sp.]
MAKIFYALNTNPLSKISFDIKCQKVKEYISKEFAELPTHFLKEDNRFLAIVGYNEELKIDLDKGCLGFVNNENWYKKETFPDGNYFIFRTNNNEMELLSDYCSTRTIWYYQKPSEYFCFSSFQLPIIIFKEDFKYNNKVTPWMISTGSLGPNNSWDKEINLLPRLTSLKFSINEDKISLSSVEVVPPEKIPQKETDLIEFFDKYLKKGFDNIVIPVKSTALLLSGGGESRLLLWYLGIKHKLQTITWTTPESETVPGSDIQIAKALSAKFDLPHTIFHLKNENLPPKEILDRFLKYGEGRIDHISGYLDGFELWKKIQQSGITSIIRGDHNFGRYKANNYASSRRIARFQFITDFENLSKYQIHQELEEQIKPLPNESPMSFAYRLILNYTNPLIYSALNDFKLNFSEVNNPLLNNSMVALSTVLPQYMMKNKRLTKKRNKINIPDIPIATSVSIESLTNIAFIFKSEFQELFAQVTPDELVIIDIPQDLFDDVNRYSKNVKENANTNNVKNLKKWIPKPIKKFLLSLKKDNISSSKLAFRMYILISMNKKINSILFEYNRP